jgi:hypothetical protein
MTCNAHKDAMFQKKIREDHGMQSAGCDFRFTKKRSNRLTSGIGWK